MLDQFSKASGTQFVTDPRVRANVSLIGLESTQLDKQMVQNVLLMHGFSAYQKDGVIYIVPAAVGDEVGGKLGEAWD